jgi:hypothetical protein
LAAQLLSADGKKSNIFTLPCDRELLVVPFFSLIIAYAIQ